MLMITNIISGKLLKEKVMKRIAANPQTIGVNVLNDLTLTHRGARSEEFFFAQLIFKLLNLKFYGLQGIKSVIIYEFAVK